MELNIFYFEIIREKYPNYFLINLFCPQIIDWI